MIREEKKVSDDLDSHKHHSGLLKALLERAMAKRFSSKPIEIKDKHNQHVSGSDGASAAQYAIDGDDKCSVITFDHRKEKELSEALKGCPPTLTLSEQAYLETLLQSEDHDSIRQAILALSDQTLFLREEGLDHVESTHAEAVAGDNNKNPNQQTAPRDSAVQRLLFRMHEIGRVPTAKDSAAAEGSKRRLSWYDRKDPLLENQTSMSFLSLEDSKYNNSLMLSQDNNAEEDGKSREREIADGLPALHVDRSTSSTTTQDISSWLDGGKGVEVDDDGVATTTSSALMAAESFFKTSFAILGTAADDASCHPHVLSPPLMESLLEFMPESLTDYHFWIKYSLIRDGPNLYTLLRQVRASTRTILAIETTDGQVFGAFTSSPWRLVHNLISTRDNNKDVNNTSPNETTGRVLDNAPAAVSEGAFYGSKDTFLWKMRKNRFDSQRLVRSSTVEQAILMESELAVFPFTGRNPYVQHCGPDDGIGLGEHASAIHLDTSLLSGSVGASETFGNPCLIDPKQKQVNFQVANLELWTLTPHDKVKDAELAELETMFQQRHQDENSRLDLLGILVGGPKS